MATKTRSSSASRGMFPWGKRAEYAASSNRRKRQKQLNQQMTALYLIITATVVLGAIVIVVNWQNAGNTKSVSCEQFPEYCVPLVGGASNSSYSAFEAASTRELDQGATGAAGVVRGMTEDNVPFIGDPDAPVHFRVVANFACSHCNTYHSGDLARFIDDYVVTGQASLAFVVNTTSAAPAYAEVAAQAAFCAGEQGAFWEMSDELYRLARAYGVTGFTMGQIGASADDMKLNRDDLVKCVSSGRYLPLILDQQTFMQDNGVSGTPTMLVRYTGETEWTRLDGGMRGYDNIAKLTELAQNTAG